MKVKKISGNLRKFLQERLSKVNPRRTELTAEEHDRLAGLEGVVERLKRGENMQNRQL